MSSDYIILLVVSLIGGTVGAFALREAKKYRARKAGNPISFHAKKPLRENP